MNAALPFPNTMYVLWDRFKVCDGHTRSAEQLRWAGEVSGEETPLDKTAQNNSLVGSPG